MKKKLKTFYVHLINHVDQRDDESTTVRAYDIENARQKFSLTEQDFL